MIRKERWRRNYTPYTYATGGEISACLFEPCSPAGWGFRTIDILDEIVFDKFANRDKERKKFKFNENTKNVTKNQIV